MLLLPPTLRVGGFVDYYILRPLLGQKSYEMDDFIVGEKLGEGGFGVVYQATGVEDGEQYVLKKCKDYGDAEIWANSRLMAGRHELLKSFTRRSKVSTLKSFCRRTFRSFTDQRTWQYGHLTKQRAWGHSHPTKQEPWQYGRLTNRERGDMVT